MSREVIQDFLNLPGVVGIALANRRMRPYFYGLDSVMERTKEVLGQGILQVMENVPDGFESFEFHFAKSIVFVYKLSHGLVLLVMADRQLNLAEYRHGIKGIKHLVESDTYNTVATFKLLLGSVTQHSLPSADITGSNIFGSSGIRPNQTSPTDNQAKRSATQSYSNSYQTNRQNTQSNNLSGGTLGNQPKPAVTTGNTTNKIIPPSEIPYPSATRTSSNQASSQPNNSQSNPTSAAYQRVPAAKTAAPMVTPTTPPPSATPQTATASLGEMLQAMNQLSQFTTQYLGKVVVANYWKSTRPDHEWLSKIEVDRNATLSHPQQGTVRCNQSQQELIHEWLMAYVKRCKQVIRNFDTMICQDCLDETQQKLLML
ncbi:MAG: hypothetical protein ACK456_00995 [Pseudanabaenaceae cyanobacterium]|jgi:hypothetical protein